MDDPKLDAAQHQQALHGLARINWWSDSAGILWAPIRRLMRTGMPQARLLDVATGAGDVPIGLWHRARRAGIKLTIAGCDRSLRAVAFAQARAARAGADVTFFTLDALTQPIPHEYDVVMSSLFLHHLEDADVVAVLRGMAQAATRLVLANDLARSLRGLALAYVGTRLLSRSPVVHHDGVRSVRAAFTVEEMRALAERAGLRGATVACRYPCRWLLSWSAA